MHTNKQTNINYRNECYWWYIWSGIAHTNTQRTLELNRENISNSTVKIVLECGIASIFVCLDWTRMKHIFTISVLLLRQTIQIMPEQSKTEFQLLIVITNDCLCTCRVCGGNFLSWNENINAFNYCMSLLCKFAWKVNENTLNSYYTKSMKLTIIT